ncbi:MAG: hypothetical protein ACYSW8_31575 [Planctomycetota bacterium]|jgi:hypothetical protein
MVVHDVDRPDVGGVPPKMQAICEACKVALSAAFLRITTNDNLCSSVAIQGALDSKEEWTNGIYQNGWCFTFFIFPPKGQRYYEEGGKIRVELQTVTHKLASVKFRKYTGPPEKVIAKIKAWIAEAASHKSNLDLAS